MSQRMRSQDTIEELLAPANRIHTTIGTLTSCKLCESYARARFGADSSSHMCHLRTAINCHKLFNHALWTFSGPRRWAHGTILKTRGHPQLEMLCLTLPISNQHAGVSPEAYAMGATSQGVPTNPLMHLSGTLPQHSW
jgi:hypothetical protein